MSAPKVGDIVRYVNDGTNVPDIWHLRKYRDGIVIKVAPGGYVTVYDAEEDDWWQAAHYRVNVVAAASYERVAS